MENLPFQDNKFDLVICRNAIDHVEDADKCVKEVERVLKDGGVFYLAINTFSGLLYWYKLINKDKEHPYTFNLKTFKNLIEKNKKYKFQLSIKQCIIDSEDHKHFEEMESKTWWKVILRKMFLKMNSYHFVELIILKR
jgi:ubiquinone/menaquinone biosynthesis C-methylase UbiE